MSQDTRAPDTHPLHRWIEPRFEYVRVNLLTGEKTVDCQMFSGRSLFLETLNRWNRLGLGRGDGKLLWAYYELVS